MGFIQIFVIEFHHVVLTVELRDYINSLHN